MTAELTVITARPESVGGFSVRRSLPAARRRMVGPFTFLDHMGPASVRMDVLPHPHIGISTLTYLFTGHVVHRDSLGNTQSIVPGEANWMVSGRGIAHSERAQSDDLHGIQAWLALPESDEETPPSFTHSDAHELPLIHEHDFDARLISGSAFGLTSPARAFSPHFYLDVRLRAGARVELPRDHEERATYVVDGRLREGEAGQLVVFESGDAVITAEEDSMVMLLGGAPLGHRFMWWNFVSSRRERIEEAKADWEAGRIALPPDDREQWIPLPPDRRPKPEPEPMS